MTLPPGPPLPVMAQTLLLGLRPLKFVESCQRRYGDRFTIHIVDGRTIVMVADPAGIKEVFSGDPEDLRAGAANSVLEPFLGTHSLLLLDGDRHRRERQLMLPALHGERMHVYRELVAEVMRRDMATWPQNRDFALRPHTQAVALEVILRAVFGLDDAEKVENVRGLMLRLLRASSSPTIMVQTWRRDLGRWSPWGRFVRRRADVDQAVYAEIRSRRQAPELAERDDILSLLLMARFDDGTELGDEELRDELMTLLLAGHETTATALAWTFDLLLQNPHELQRLKAQLRRGDQTYVDAVIKEALRLRPVIPEVGRRLQRPMNVAGMDLPAGVLISPAIYLAHMNPEVFPDPKVFRPERFLSTSVDTFSWIPFGGGRRRCLGAAFATMEMREILSTVIRNVDLCPVDRRPERPTRRAVTLSPSRGCRVRIAA